MKGLYNTADDLEDLDMVEELNSYSTVTAVYERHEFGILSHLEILKEADKSLDFVIFVSDDAEKNKIKELLKPCGYTAIILDAYNPLG